MQIYVQNIRKIQDNVQIDIRNGSKRIVVGDEFRGAKIIKIETYGRELVELPPNFTGCITLGRMPKDCLN